MRGCLMEIEMELQLRVELFEVWEPFLGLQCIVRSLFVADTLLPAGSPWTTLASDLRQVVVLLYKRNPCSFSPRRERWTFGKNGEQPAAWDEGFTRAVVRWRCRAAVKAPIFSKICLTECRTMAEFARCTTLPERVEPGECHSSSLEPEVVPTRP